MALDLVRLQAAGDGRLDGCVELAGIEADDQAGRGFDDGLVGGIEEPQQAASESLAGVRVDASQGWVKPPG